MRALIVCSLLFTLSACGGTESACKSLCEFLDKCDLVDNCSDADIEECVDETEEGGDACESAMQALADCLDDKEPSCSDETTCLEEAEDVGAHCD